MLNNIFMISLSMSAVILLLLIVSPLLNKRYSAKWRYSVWLIVALRLVIPFKLELPSAPVNIPAPQNQTIVFRQEGIPFRIMDESYAQMGNTSSTSADYAPIMTMQELLTIIWAIGAASFLLYHIASYIIFTRKIKPYCSKIDTEILCNVLGDMKIKKKPQLLECSRIASPMMIGFFRPAILLPNTDYSNDELTVILKHELTHYKRGDLWYKLLLILANAMHWFNPFVYFMERAASRDIEYSCDDAVVKDTDINDRKIYSMTILKSMQKGETTTLSTSFSESGKSAKKRFDNILNTKAKKTGVIAFTAIVLLVGIMAAMLNMGNGGYTYQNASLGFRITTPTHWDWKCFIDVQGERVSFYHTPTREVYEFAGLLFYIELAEGTLTPEEVAENPANRSIIMYANGYTYLFGLPTDVQYPVWSDGDPEENKRLADDYLHLAKDLEKVKKSVKSIDIFPTANTGDVEKLYKLKDSYTGDNSKVSAILNLLPYPQYPLFSMALATDSQPYGIALNYKVESRANYRFLNYADFHKSAALLFALIPNLGEIHVGVYDSYSDITNPDTRFAGAYYNRQNISQRPSMEYFTEETISTAAASIERFTHYCNKVAAIYSDSNHDENFPQDAHLTEIYSIIGDDCEITTNSGMALHVIITDEVVKDSELNVALKPYGVSLSDWLGKDIRFNTSHVRNFKTNVGSSYLFIYDGATLLHYADLHSETRDRELIHMLVPYSYDGGTL